MTQINRRMLLGGAALVAVLGGAGYAWQTGLLRLGASTSSDSGLDVAKPANVDPAKLNEPHPLGERVLGAADAKVTIIEYASATCPHCADFHRDTFPKLKAEYVDTGKARFVFREFPFDDLALAAFMVARCAAPEQYYPIMDVLFEQQQQWARSNDPRGALFAIASQAGFTQESFDACLKNEAVAKGVIGGRDRAAKEFGVDSTPTFFINGKVISGAAPLEEFRATIDAALKG